MKDHDFRHFIRRIMTALPLLALMSVLLCGCVKKHYQADIKSYVAKKTGRDSLVVSEAYQEIHEDEEGYLDHLWTVTDEGTGMVFHVLDDYYWALEAVNNQLLDDYDSSVFLWLLENRKFPETKNLFLRKTSKSGLVNAEVVCSFSDENSMRAVYEELMSLRKAAEDEGYRDLKVMYTAQYNHPLRNVIEYEDAGGDTTGEIGALDENACSLMRKNYLACALDYYFEDILKDFSQDEINEVVNSPESVRIYKVKGESGAQDNSDSEDRIYYEGVIGNPQYAGISFGTLYELLRQENINVTGNAWHYSFPSPQGDIVEISYDFNDLSGYNDKAGKLRKGYYYIRDGKKVRMKNYYNNHFDAAAIEEITGLRVFEDRPYLTEKEETE